MAADSGVPDGRDPGETGSIGKIAGEELGAVSVEVAESLARFLVEDRPADLIQTAKSSATDIVTHMDAMAEQMARELLALRRPEDGFLGEEGTQRDAPSGLTWIVDPIDGTTNYLYRLPAWAVSVAVSYEGRSIAGCVCSPELDMTASAVRGAGAMVRRGGEQSRLAVSSQRNLSESLIGTGFGYASRRREQQGRLVAQVLPRVRDMSRSGAASVDLCRVAAGQLDGYYERGLHAWDFAAGALIVEEAGGIVTTADGHSVWGLYEGAAGMTGEWDTIVAAAPGIHSDVIRLLEDAGDTDDV